MLTEDVYLQGQLSWEEPSPDTKALSLSGTHEDLTCWTLHSYKLAFPTQQRFVPGFRMPQESVLCVDKTLLTIQLTITPVC